MAIITYNVQDDTATFDVGCSGSGGGAATTGAQAMDQTAAGVGTVGGAPGPSLDLPCIVFDGNAPGASASWDAGNWQIPFSFSACDAGSIISRIDICDFDGSTYTTVVGNHTVTGHSRGSTTPFTETVVQGSAHTPQNANSRPFIIIWIENNDLHGASLVTLNNTETITSPIDDGVTAGLSTPMGPATLMPVDLEPEILTMIGG